MNKIWITFVTENQNTKKQAKELADALIKNIGLKREVKIEEYTKFSNSFKIDLETEVQNKKEINLACIKVCSKIAQPWFTYFDSDTETVELIFNKTNNSQFEKQEYTAIKWANAGVVKI